MKNNLLPVFMVALAIGLGGGCSFYEGGPATAEPTGTTSYGAGTLKWTEAVPYDEAVDAALTGLKDLNDPVVDRIADGITFKIIARSLGDHKVTVTIQKVSGTVSEFSVHVDTFGSEDSSRVVMDAINKHL
jgi:hypothetical protein